MVTVRYFASARAAAGVSEEISSATTLAELVAELAGARGAQLEKIFGVASFLVDGVVSHDRDAHLRAGATVDVLPPFAGG